MTEPDGGQSPVDTSPRILAGHYRVERELGRGGMATVFLCTDQRDGGEVAFKLLDPEISNTVTRERFLREVAFVSELDHPGIPKVIDSGVEGDDPFYAMTFVSGESLRTRLDREKQLPLPEVARIARETVKPMRYAHDRSIVHRDIKPENILLSDDGVFVLDFGIARAVVAAAGDRLTKTGMVIGTPAYMSPEQAVGESEIDLRSDIYSLGCVVYEMIAGVPPFAAASPQVLMHRRISATPRPLLEVRADVPETLDRAVAKALARAPEDRWQTAVAFAEALDLAIPVAALRVTGEHSLALPSPDASAEGAAGERGRRGDDLLRQLQSTFAGIYTVDLEMKSGGMSRLFLATDPELGRRVVIKILPPELTSQMMLARFRRESEVTARLQHPHILPVISAGVRDGLAHYVMPFFEGESLRGRMEREGKLSVSDGVRILSEVADALSYAHKQGVVHRDIKPENILIQDGHAVLADFGIAAAMSGLGNESGERLTGTGMSLGTVGYMAPEQALGERNVDARADIYAVGVVGYEIFAGAAPFTGATEQAILVAHLTREAVRLEDVRLDTPAAVSDAIRKAMAKDPAERFQTAAEFRDALETARGGTQSRPALVFKPKIFRQLSRRWKIAAPLALVAVAGVGAAIKYWSRPAATDFVTIAIAPFNTPEAALALWREGMVDVMARNLDGAGPLRTVSPTLSVKGFSGVANQESATELARRTNAQYAIFGNLTGSANSVQIRATLVNVSDNAVWEYNGQDTTAEGAATKFTFAVLEELGKSHTIGAVRQSSFGSSSIDALREFLRGEQFYRRTSWDSAAVAYLRAISFDENFAIALRRAAQVTAWQRNGIDSMARTFRLRAGSANHGLSPRDSLLLVADSMSAALAPLPSDSMNWQMLGRLFATLNDAASRYPDDPEVWYAVGEARFHQGYGSPANITERQALDAFDRSIALDSAFAPAYVHAVELGLTLDGVEAGSRYARAYLQLNPTDDEAEGIAIVHQVTQQSGGGGAPAVALPPGASTDAAMAAYYIIRRWPDSAQTAIRLLQAAGNQPKTSPTYASDSARLSGFLPVQLAYRGRLAESYRSLGPQPSRLFAEIATLGGIPPDTAAAVFSRWLKERRPQAFLALPWLTDRGDTVQIRMLMAVADSASRAGSEFSQRGARYRAASTRAYMSLARRDTADAMIRFATLSDTLCISCYVDRLRFARLLAARGRLPDAERILSERINSLLTPTEVSMALERGRVAGKLGKPEEALRAYGLVAAAWGGGDAILQPLVAEAQREINRLRPQR